MFKSHFPPGVSARPDDPTTECSLVEDGVNLTCSHSASRPSPWAKRYFPRDQPRAAAAGGEAERPSDEDEDAVLEANQVPEMDEEPGAPGDEPGQPQPFDVGDRRRATDDCEVPLVAVAERRQGAGTQPSLHDLGDVAALLHRDWRDSLKNDRYAVRSADANHVAERKDFGMCWEREVRLDRHSSRVVSLGPAQLAELRGEARRHSPQLPRSPCDSGGARARHSRPR
jgi:hypothetical protein